MASMQKLAEPPTSASPHLPAAQLSAKMLRLCGPSKVTHLLRSIAPSNSRPAASSYDKALLQAHEVITELDPLTDSQVQQVQLPLRAGGRGLRSQEGTAAAAWVASWAQNLAAVQERAGIPLAQECRQAYAALSALSLEDTLSWTDLATQPRRKLQREICRKLDDKKKVALLNSLEPADRARLRSCGGPLAAGWQLATPSCPELTLEDSAYKLTSRSVLGQTVVPPFCTSCQNVARTGASAGRACGEPLDRTGRHAHNCNRGGGLNARSASLEDAWELIHRECKQRVDRQVRVPGWDRFNFECSCGRKGTTLSPTTVCPSCGARTDVTREEAILDLEVQGVGSPVLYFDVTVHNGTPGNVDRLTAAAAGRDGAVNTEAERTKRARYPDRATPWKAVPLAHKTFGRLGTSAFAHLCKLAKEQASRLDCEGSSYAVSALVQRWGCVLSVALQRANARNLRRALGTSAAAACADSLPGRIVAGLC